MTTTESPPATSVRPPSARKRGAKPWNQRLAPYLFVLPNMLVFGVFIIYPALNGFNISLYNSNNGRAFTPVGTRNYRRLFTDEEFWQAAGATVIFVVAFVAVCTAASIGLAMLLTKPIRARGFFRAVFFLPVLLSPVVVGLLWGWILERRSGALNAILGAVGLPEPGWLVSGPLALGATVFVGVWAHAGFYTLIMMAGLQAIDSSYYEAAHLDGAGAWHRFRHITWPLLRPTTLVVVILAMIAGFQSFDFIYTLSGGGPLGATTLMVQYIYEHAFQSPIQYGLAAAGSVVLFCTIFALTVLNFLYGRRKESM
ncbi:carbohydrate ABC transporter membrane protein 1 (CUT1 family) [Saccharopolyspora erythraea NRRL 2338]|uniref:ABC transporter sugar permease n=2 Tax=Saccharopolyspora erythraea TaxID=1836 RepID=A4FJ70_SACEN|nr:sugar ABC transporter permease [Saccharopolyspora erythraea]EQD83556.1 suagr ABC transporter permease [Saccharopolyspora erythraea D]PFG97764.1 carbohydrate ABC transporter membrane protein 1 (CUT1 family) [Saccharopolyspora erythraea NRRL 2338]QRK87911.1 sugar ABC transporter permease [Saccharopolyspora erythraea]CAM04095.1 ABC transporter sugar permease [Saccharopolyspora erythraea NRRL 2338]